MNNFLRKVILRYFRYKLLKKVPNLKTFKNIRELENYIYGWCYWKDLIHNNFNEQDLKIITKVNKTVSRFISLDAFQKQKYKNSWFENFIKGKFEEL